jgi:hypothetical protein
MTAQARYRTASAIEPLVRLKAALIAVPGPPPGLASHEVLELPLHEEPRQVPHEVPGQPAELALHVGQVLHVGRVPGLSGSSCSAQSA